MMGLDGGFGGFGGVVVGLVGGRRVWGGVVMMMLVVGVGLGGCGPSWNVMKFNEGVAAGRGFQVRAEPATGREYGVFVPHNYDPNRAYPVILFLHGLFESGSDVQKVMRSGIGPVVVERSKTMEYIVVFPQARGEWKSAGEIEFVQRVLNDVKKSYRVDVERIIVTGLSTGGWGCWAMAEKYPNQFAAVVPVCGHDRIEAVGSLKNTPVWAFHNSLDPIIGLWESKKMIEALKAQGSTQVQLTVYDAVGHDAWSRAYREEALWKWMGERRK